MTFKYQSYVYKYIIYSINRDLISYNNVQNLEVYATTVMMYVMLKNITLIKVMKSNYCMISYGTEKVC